MPAHHRRRAGPRSRSATTSPSRPGSDGALDDELLRSERDSLLWQAVTLLRPEDQALVRMLASDPPASYAEISAALDMPIGSIGPTRARCLERLRARCEQLCLLAAE